MLGMFNCGKPQHHSRFRHRALPERGWVQFLLLVLLNEESKHGYALIDEIEQRGFVQRGRFKTGSIYTILSRMEKNGLLKSTEKMSDEGRTRRVYSITEEGRNRLKLGLEHLLWRKKLLDKLEKYYKEYFGDNVSNAKSEEK
jgi:PadR family transcriptional regulator PadR